MKVIARIHCDFKEKFGIPRQSGLVPQTRARIVFEPEYRNPDALRGIETYSHLWLIWAFSKAERESWSPTVRPPRLGGNTRLGVFATRSPFRPNPIGLSSVTLEEVILHSPDGPVLVVGGADLLDGTPIYDIKPYLPYVDSHPDARGGFTERQRDMRLRWSSRMRSCSGLTGISEKRCAACSPAIPGRRIRMIPRVCTACATRSIMSSSQWMRER